MGHNMATRKLKIKLTERGRWSVPDGKLSQTASFRRAVRRAIATTKKNGNPVARYDVQRRQAYLEYPGGKRTYVE